MKFCNEEAGMGKSKFATRIATMKGVIIYHFPNHLSRNWLNVIILKRKTTSARHADDEQSQIVKLDNENCNSFIVLFKCGPILAVG